MRCITYCQSIKFRYKFRVQFSAINQSFFLFCFLWTGECFATKWARLVLIAAPEDPLLESVRPLDWAVFTVFLYSMSSDQEQVIYNEQSAKLKKIIKLATIPGFLKPGFSRVRVSCS